MAWLWIGAMLLLLASRGSDGKRGFDAVGLGSLVFLVAGSLWSLRVYAPLTVAVLLSTSVCASMLLLRLLPRMPVAARSALGAAGAAAILFALFGPPEGLF